MKLRYSIHELPFVHPFRISKGIKSVQPIFFVELDFMGIKGYGEAPAISYYNIPVEKMASDLELKRKFVEQFAFSEPERFWHYLHHLFPNNPFLVCALDMAGWDIYGKLKRKALYQFWTPEKATMPLTDFTIGIDSTELMLKKIKEKPWPIYKLKVGFENDIEMLGEIRKNTDAIVRVDANEGWTLEQAQEKIPQLQSLGVELIEQPLLKTSRDEMKILYKDSSIPLIADEACVSEKDLKTCIGHFHGINIKLTKCSGITPARRMIREAKLAGIKVMLGCMNETSIGSAAIAHLAPDVDYLDMDGPLLLAKDVATGLIYENGIVTMPTGYGLGVTVIDDLFQS